MKAAIYARYSSENQRDTSLEDQIRLCREEAARQGYEVVAVWQDAELSGQIADRPGLRAMLEGAERKDFNVLLVDDASRLSRDTADALSLLKRLQFWGISFIARSDGVNTVLNPRNSHLIYGMKSVFNEEFLRDLADKTRRGLEGQVRRGFNAGGLPYGYRNELVPGAREGEVLGYRLLPHKEEGEVVRRIFRMRVGDGETRPLSLREITHRLNADRIPPPGSRWKNRSRRQCATWSYTAVRGVLLNPIYTGRVVWNRTHWIRHPDTRRRVRRVRPTNDWVERRDESLRVVPNELWDRAQAQAAAARVGSGFPEYRFRGRAKYLLSGFVMCGVCGAHYVIANRTSYRCGSSRNRGPAACTNHLAIPRRRLEKAVLAALRDHLYTPENLASLVSEVRTALLRRAEQYRERIHADPRDKALAQLDLEIENIKRAVAMGKATHTLLEMLEERASRRDGLLGQRAPASAVEERVGRTLDRLPALIERAFEDLQTLLSVSQVDKGKELLALLVEGIFLHPTNGGLEAEIRGSLQGLLKLQPPASRPGAECNFVGSGGRI